MHRPAIEKIRLNYISKYLNQFQSVSICYVWKYLTTSYDSIGYGSKCLSWLWLKVSQFVMSQSVLTCHISIYHISIYHVSMCLNLSCPKIFQCHVSQVVAFQSVSISHVSNSQFVMSQFVLLILNCPKSLSQICLRIELAYTIAKIAIPLSFIKQVKQSCIINQTRFNQP